MRSFSSWVLAGCAAKQRPKSAARSAAPRAPLPWIGDPFPSTCRGYPGVPTLVTGVTVYDGDGGRIDGGSVLIADGKVRRWGRRSLRPPAPSSSLPSAGDALAREVGA